MTGNDGRPRPPCAARWFLVRLTGPDDREVVDGLDELFEDRARRDGRGPACRWYWRQVLGFALRWRPFSRSVGGLGSMDGGMGLDAWTRDIRLAVRSLARSPGLAVAAILTLALGIGANTAIFSVIRGSLLRPLPYADPDRLVRLSDGHPNFGGAGVNQSIPNLVDLRDASRLLRSVAMYRVISGNLSSEEEAERVPVLHTSSEMLSVLGVAPALGRDLLPDDDDTDAEPVVLLSYGLWRSHFGADPDVVGRTTTLNARTARIVGVLPAAFTFPGDPRVVTTLQHVGSNLSRNSRGYFGIGRLAADTDLTALREELGGIFDRLVEAYPDENEGWYTWAEPMKDVVVGRNARSLYLMGGAVALVLLIACVNVANLLLVRAENRQRELAVRFSLGARRSGLISQFVSEGLVLSVGGGLVGLVGARWGVDLLVALYGDSLPRATQVHMDSAVLGFALATTLAAGVLVGFVPLFRIHPDRLHHVLKDGSRGSSHRGSVLSRALVVSEVALAVLVVAGAGLLAKSMWRLQEEELGMADADRVMTFRMALPGADYGEPNAIVDFTDELEARIQALPGVEAVGFVNRLPLLGGDNTSVSVTGDPERFADFVSVRMITPGYFDAIGVPLVAGRWLEPAEFRGPTSSVIINQTLARQLFGADDPLGRRIDLHNEVLVVVGVCGDVAGNSPDRPPPAAFYYPLAPMLVAWGAMPPTEQFFISALTRTVGDPRAAVPALREAVTSLDSDLPVYSPLTLAEIAEDRLGVRRFAMSLFGVFAALALLLGGIGIYGVMSFTVARRAPEMGMRMALGASRRSVLRTVLGHGVRLTAPGVLVGLALAMASGRVLGNLLFEVSPLDPWTYLLVASVLALVALAATLIPALRATLVDPLTSIRSE